jgi:DNA-binding NtrC family response regulator
MHPQFALAETTNLNRKAPTNSSSQPHILVFDDDLIFTSILKRQAEKLNVRMTICNELEDFTLAALESDFDVVLLDYMLEEYRGPDVARVLEGQPVLLISQHRDLTATTKDWPVEIKGFLSKTAEPKTIITTALQFIKKEVNQRAA